ncbi:MAG: MFS transporter [Chitinispirillaceae bacterium]|nr:MFS transporter [Chitinispirillaceae bacterium]
MSQSPSKRTSTAGIVTASILAAFLPPYMASSLNVALPAIGREFALPAVSLSWLITSYLLAIAVCIVPFGKAGDQYGRRTVFFWGTVSYTATTFAAGCAGSAAALLVLRVAQGIGAAMIFSSGIALLVAAIPGSRRGSMLGLNVASTYIGLSVGPSLGGLLTQYLGWQSIFFTSVPLGLLLIAVVHWKVHEEKPAPPEESFDVAGAVTYGCALAAFMIGLPYVQSIHGRLLSVAGAALFALFVFIETQVKAPVIPLGLFRHNTVFSFSGLAALLNYSATHGTGFLLSLYLQSVRGLPPRNAGFVLIAWPLLMALFSPLAGKLSDRVEPRIVASGGMALTAGGLFYFSALTVTASLQAIIAGLLALGTGIAFFSSPNASAIMGSVSKQHYGMAVSIVGTMRLIGQMLSMGIVAVIMNAFVGNQMITAARQVAFMSGMRTLFLIFGILCTLGVFASLARGRVREKPDRWERLLPGSPVAG